jgi:hypothetical protein
MPEKQPEVVCALIIIGEMSLYKYGYEGSYAKISVISPPIQPVVFILKIS